MDGDADSVANLATFQTTLATFLKKKFKAPIATNLYGVCPNLI